MARFDSKYLADLFLDYVIFDLSFWGLRRDNLIGFAGPLCYGVVLFWIYADHIRTSHLIDSSG